MKLQINYYLVYASKTNAVHRKHPGWKSDHIYFSQAV